MTRRLAFGAGDGRLARAGGGPARRRWRRGSELRSGALRLDVIWPPRELLGGSHAGADPNLLALVIVARWHRFSMLLTADAEAESTPLDPGPVDVLKVAHHGSEDAGLAALLDRTRPRLAVISVGEDNTFGHPTPATLAMLAAHHVRTLRTDLDGTTPSKLGQERECPEGADTQSERSERVPAGHSLSCPRLGWMASEMGPLYMIAGTDQAKIEETRRGFAPGLSARAGLRRWRSSRRARAPGPPDHEALLGAIPAMSLTESRRYLLADGVDRWRDAQLDRSLPRSATFRRTSPSSSSPVANPPRNWPRRSRRRGASCTSSRSRAPARCRGRWSPKRSGSVSARAGRGAAPRRPDGDRHIAPPQRARAPRALGRPGW